jgi:type II secretory ATPase GspE/PulE/Tfp pilus assembly ATPase PilB-like protein
MVGEIRDVETADIACRAALTGHLVLSTVHTQHALGTVARLIDMGIAPWLIAACLNGVLAQRLVRRICEQCAEEYTLSPHLERAFQSRFGSLEGARFLKGRGCAACHRTGVRGRIGVYELLTVDDELRGLLAEDPSLSRLRERIFARGFRSIEEDAFHKACLGMIAPEEVVDLGFGVSMAVRRTERVTAPHAEPCHRSE